jgi:hypothetical protein
MLLLRFARWGRRFFLAISALLVRLAFSRACAKIFKPAWELVKVQSYAISVRKTA